MTYAPHGLSYSALERLADIDEHPLADAAVKARFARIRDTMLGPALHAHCTIDPDHYAQALFASDVRGMIQAMREHADTIPYERRFIGEGKRIAAYPELLASYLIAADQTLQDSPSMPRNSYEGETLAMRAFLHTAFPDQLSAISYFESERAAISHALKRTLRKPAPVGLACPAAQRNLARIVEAFEDKHMLHAQGVLNAYPRAGRTSYGGEMRAQSRAPRAYPRGSTR